MEIGFRINLYRNTVDALVDTTQDAENATQATQGTTQVRLTEEDKDVLAAIKEQHNITQKARKIKLFSGFPKKSQKISTHILTVLTNKCYSTTRTKEEG